LGVQKNVLGSRVTGAGGSWLEVGFEWLLFVRYEALLFVCFWFTVATIDGLAVDGRWLWLRLTGRGHAMRMSPGVEALELNGRAAVFVPAWQEAEVIGPMIAHTLRAWSQRELRLYIGCYGNDVATVAAAIAAAGKDPRVRIVVHGVEGPTTKADCLNRLYRALCSDEARSGVRFRSVVLHDAEDMVHPAGLVAIDRALDYADYVQLPVRPELQPHSRWVAGHYADEFLEAHTKDLVVRDNLRAALPAAGVGCGFSRIMLEKLSRMGRASVGQGPFAAECLTEDYELGVLVTRAGGKGRFLRLRDSEGALIATRSFFPAGFDEAVRQKTRWIHGIAFQGWERLGWHLRPVEVWMTVRDRRGPLTAMILAIAYVQIFLEGVVLLAGASGVHASAPIPPHVAVILKVNFLFFGWRAALRYAFTAREYGKLEGLRAVLRIPIANIIAIISGTRAFANYLRSFSGDPVRWDKTVHDAHPAALNPPVVG